MKGDLLKDFMNFKREQYMEESKTTLFEYKDLLQFSHRLIGQAVEKGKDPEGTSFTAVELVKLKEIHRRVGKEIEHLDELTD